MAIIDYNLQGGKYLQVVQMQKKSICTWKVGYKGITVI